MHRVPACRSHGVAFNASVLFIANFLSHSALAYNRGRALVRGRRAEGCADRKLFTWLSATALLPGSWATGSAVLATINRYAVA